MASRRYEWVYDETLVPEALEIARATTQVAKSTVKREEVAQAREPGNAPKMPKRCAPSSLIS